MSEKKDSHRLTIEGRIRRTFKISLAITSSIAISFSVTFILIPDLFIRIVSAIGFLISGISSLIIIIKQAALEFLWIAYRPPWR